MAWWIVRLLLVILTVGTVAWAATIPKYDRREWRHWVDATPCVSTRQAVIAREGVYVSWTDGGCFVRDVQIRSMYSSGYLEPKNAREVQTEIDVDHLVPLGHAHESGGWRWTRERKQEYANYLGFRAHLVPVEPSLNRSKGAKGPDQWMPPDPARWCWYLTSWATVKYVWGLSATEAEREFVKRALREAAC